MVATCNDNEYEKFLLKKGQVAITKDSEKRNDIGIPTFIAEDFDDVVLGYHLALITPYPYKLDGAFLHFWLNTEYGKKYFENNASGSGQRLTLTLDIIKSIPLYLPDLPTQKSIAKVLSDLDAKIELNNKINRELEAMAKTLYDYWFVQFDFPYSPPLEGCPQDGVGIGKPYKSSGGKMVYNAELKREIPDGWEVKTLLNIATYTNGLACQKYRPTNEEYLPVIKIREMRDGFTEGTEKVKVNIPERLIVNNGDVLFSWSASLEVMIWTGGKGGLNQHIFKVTSKMYPRSFYYFQLIWYLQHFKMIAELRKTTMGHITQDHLKQSRIVVPPLDIVKDLDKKLKPIQEKQILISRQNQHLTTLRDWLLPMLMNGQVRVKEAEERLNMAAEPSVEYKTKIKV
ncbi:MAG: restriction endonuclease subunit S [Bacteroidetes bacterium]|nr:restriction endonuclease subunit S [Bacteroidota bacterium]MCB9042960.1 restriction endonuclease subunit S [Chitinophagales bacterium]